MPVHAFQLDLMQPNAEQSARWAHEGVACGACPDGEQHMVHPSEACECKESICNCLAEGYARCDSCGTLRQVWPREMVAAWKIVPAANRRKA
jgi:hypothetical protein